MTRTRRFLGGLAFGYANQALITVVGLWLTTFLLGRLGQTDYGLWLVATRILSYLMLMDLGVVALLPRETAFATGRAGGVANATDLPDIIGRAARIVVWQMPLVLLVAAIIWIALPEDWAALRDPLGVVMIIFVLSFPLRIFQAVLNGLQDLAHLGAIYTGSWIVGTAATVGLVFAGLGLYALAVGWAISQLVSALFWWRRLRRQFPGVLPTAAPKLSWSRLRDRLSRGLWISAAQVAQVLVHGTDLLIIGKLIGPQAVVPYFCTAKVLMVLGHQPQMLAQTAQPALSELRAGSERHRLADVSTALTRAILILSGAIACVVLVVNQGFVTWWVGSDQYGGFALTAVLLAAMLLRHWNVTAIYSLFSFGHDRRISLTTLADGIVTVGASIVLVMQYGLIGAAIGSVLGVVLIGLPANLIGLSKEMGVSAMRLAGSLWPWSWRFAVIATTAGAVAQVWVPDTLPALVAATLAAVSAYGILMLPLALRDPLGMYVRPRLAAFRRIVLRSTAIGDVEG